MSQHAYELSPGTAFDLVVDEVVTERQVIYLTREGRPVGAVVPADVVPAALEAMEDAEDLAVAEAAMAEWEAGGRVTHPLSEVLRGLDD